MYRTGSEMERSELDYWRNPMLPVLKPFHSFIDRFTVLTWTSWGKSVRVKLPNIKVIPGDTS